MSGVESEFWDKRRLLPTVAMLLCFWPGLVTTLGIPLSFAVLMVLPFRYALANSNRIFVQRWLKYGLVVICLSFWWTAFSSKFALEPAVGLLVLGAWLKLAEANDRRDGYVLVYSGFLIAASVFLLQQTLWQALWVSLGVVLGFWSLLEYELSPSCRLSRTKRVAIPSGTVLLAIPLTLVWFLIFPRMAPLWAIPITAEVSRLGMSDTLRPGDVTQLGRDASLAFRVEFSGEMPQYSDLYWRGITLGRFDNGTWRQHRVLQRPPRATIVPMSPLSEPRLDYTVFQKASHRHWVYVLNPSTSADDRLQSLSDRTLRSRWPITSDMAFDLSHAEASLPKASLGTMVSRLETQFPRGLNPRAEALVVSLTVPGNTQATIAKVLDWYQSQPFFYTLEPEPIQEPDFVDRFLFDTQSGFCEHYAYSFVALLRLAGIPARIVGGYMGGEVNPLNGTVSVREMDAHAWTEVWIDNRGWVRVDPTATVAPERIQRGALETLEGIGGYLGASPLSLLHLRDWQLINRIRLSLDDLNYRWQSVVMGYDKDQQVRALTKLMGEISPLRIIALFIAAIILSLLPLALIGLIKWYRYRRQPSIQAVMALDRMLASMGVARYPGETLRNAVARAREAGHESEQTDSELLNSLARAEAYLYGAK